MVRKKAERFPEPLKHTSGYYAQQLGRTIKNLDWRNLMKTYAEIYGDRAIIENGIITKQNTTLDVKPGETQRQAKKLGLIIDKNGNPPLMHKSAAKNSDPNTLSNLGIGNK
jgi:hypothetical protein